MNPELNLRLKKILTEIDSWLSNDWDDNLTLYSAGSFLIEVKSLLLALSNPKQGE